MTEKYIELRNTLLQDIADHDGWDNPELREELESYLVEGGSKEDNADYFDNHARL